MRLALIAILLAADPAPAPAPEPAPAPDAAPASGAAVAPAPTLAALLERADAAWKLRDQPGRLEEGDAALAEAAKLEPEGYALLWRQARQLFWKADDPALPKEEKSRLGKEGWERGDRAAAARPDRVEGWFYAAAGVGNYALGIGVLTALSRGIEGKYRERLGKAEALDPGYDGGAIATAWGRFWYELPWPKYDDRKCEARLRQALRMNPKNVRAKVYLAELHLKEDRPQEAKALLEEAAAQEPGAYDAPEERRWQAQARKLIGSKR